MYIVQPTQHVGELEQLVVVSAVNLLGPRPKDQDKRRSVVFRTEFPNQARRSR